MTTPEFRRARSPEQQEQRRAAILRAARTMLDEQPVAEVSLRELSRRVGLAKSNVVRYFATREAVFLAVLLEDWQEWLDELATRLPRPDARRRPSTQHALVAAAIAETLGARRRLCELLAASPGVLEHNVPAEAARAFKAGVLDRLRTLAALVRAAVPALDDPPALEFAGLVWALSVGAWPAANPAPVVAAVLAEPEFAVLRVQFVPALTRALSVALDGLRG